MTGEVRHIGTVSVRTNMPQSDRPAFVRHTEDAAVPKQALWQLWKDNRIAIHWANRGGGPDPDTLDEAKHDTKEARMAVAIFRTLNDQGGIVVAKSFADKGIVRIGRIEPNSFKALPTEWTPTPGAKEKGYLRAPG